MSSTIKGSLMVDNLLSLTSTPLTDKTAGRLPLGWAAFIHPDHPGVYHPALGWVYVRSDNSNGFWFGIRIQSLVVDKAWRLPSLLS